MSEILNLSYRSKRGKIGGTDLHHNTSSQLKSSMNPGGSTAVPKLTKPVAKAVIALMDGRVAAAKVGKKYYIEAASKNVADRKYCLLYDSHKKELTYIIKEGGVVKRDTEVVSDKFIHWSAVVPRLVQLFDEGHSELYGFFDEVYKDYKANGIVTKAVKDAFCLLNGYLYYYTKDQEPYCELNSVVQQDFTPFGYDKELTSLYHDKSVDFQFATSNQSNAKKSSKKAKKSKPRKGKDNFNPNEFKLPWKEPMTKQQEAKVPKLDLDFIVETEWMHTALRLVVGEYDSRTPVFNLMLFGAAGTGKSTAAQYFAQRFGIPYYAQAISSELEKFDLLSSWNPKSSDKGGENITVIRRLLQKIYDNAEGLDIAKGQTVATELVKAFTSVLGETGGSGYDFVESPFVKAYKYGGLVELQEVAMGRQSVMALLFQALDGVTDSLVLTNGEVVKRHPNFVCVASTNVEYTDCGDINGAFKSRFHYIKKVEKPERSKLIKIIKDMSGNDDERLINKILDFEPRFKKFIQDNGIRDAVISTREIANMARLAKYVSPLEAAESSIIPAISMRSDLYEDALDMIRTTLK